MHQEGKTPQYQTLGWGLEYLKIGRQLTFKNKHNILTLIIITSSYNRILYVSKYIAKRLKVYKTYIAVYQN